MGYFLCSERCLICRSCWGVLRFIAVCEHNQPSDPSREIGLDRLGIAMAPQCVGEWPRPAGAPMGPDRLITLTLLERLRRRFGRPKVMQDHQADHRRGTSVE